MKHAAAAIVAVSALVGAFILGRLSVPPPALEVRRSPHPGWVETWRDGELHGEWNRERDPDIWPVLDQILRDAPELYQAPTPGATPRGRGPRLQQARR